MGNSDNKIKTDLDNVKNKNKNNIKIINNLEMDRLNDIVFVLEQIKKDVQAIKERLNNGENGK